MTTSGSASQGAASPGRYRREIVAVFNDAAGLEAAVSELSGSGWDRSEISLLGQHSVLHPEPVRGNTATGLADDPDADHAAVVSEPDVRQVRTMTTSMAGVAAAFLASGAVVMTGGTALLAIVGAAAAGGGAALAMNAVGNLVSGSRDEFIEEQVRHGGILLWALLRNPAEEAKARDILTRHGGTSIHVHEGPEAGEA